MTQNVIINFLRVHQNWDLKNMTQLFSQNNNSLQKILAAACLFFIVVATHYPAMSGGFVWDDDLHITDNELLRSVDGLRKIWFEPGAWPHYYPLVLTSFWIQYQLWGLDPFGYHLTNIIIHGFSAILLWRILKNLNISGAWIAACIFAVHPVQVESVAWASENKNILSGFFYLSSLLFYVHFAFQNAKGTSVKLFHSRKKAIFYFLSLFFFLLALFAKTVTCSLPAVIVVLLWWKRDRITGKDLYPLLPFFLFGIILGLSTVWTELYNVGSMGKSTWDLSFLDRLLIAGRCLWFYIGKLIFPYDIMFEYPRWNIDTNQWRQFLYPISFCLVLFLLWLYRKKIGKGPLAALLIFSGTLFPAIGFFNLFTMRYSYVADHFQYLACITVITLFSGILVKSITRYAGKHVRIIMMVAFGFFIVLCGYINWHESKKFKNLEALWRDTISKNPDAVMAHNNLGIILKQQGLTNQAIQHFSRTIELRPDWAEPYVNLGSILIRCGRLSEAIQNFTISLKNDPDSVQRFYKKGIISKSREKTGKIIDSHIIIAQLYESIGEIENAKQHYTIALQNQSNSPEILKYMVNLEKKMEAFRMAKNEIQKEIESNPNNPYLFYALGETYQKIGQHNEAIFYYNKAIEIKKGFLKALNQLAQIYSRIAKNNEAIMIYKKVVMLKPELSAKIYYNIACQYSKQQMAVQSIRYLTKAIQHGFNKKELIEKDPDLAYIRTVGWKF
ncbi:MAG: tetratricopeptide repeat protein [Desulfobacteraceae bacterium]|nr:MAG: tetratricopeptide repeat protein [Desulfobacteraceae bacterium]